LGDKLSLTFGARLSHERKRVRNQLRAVTPGVIGPNARRAGELDFEFDHSARFTNWSPMAALSYQASSDLLFYASAGKASKSGGFNGRASSSALTAPVDDETVVAYELGTKSSWLHRRLMLDVAAFWSRYQNIQLTVPRGANGRAQTLVLNAGEARIHGLEVEARALLFPGLQLSAALGLTRAGYREFDDPADPRARDRRLPGVPSTTLNFAASYEFSIGRVGSLRLRGEWTHRGRSGTDVVNTRLLRRGKSGELDASLTLALIDGRTEVSIYAKNLLDRTYLVNGVSHGASYGNATRYFNDPRSYGLEVRREF
jgi:iron complex outermembrane receptor protein